MKPTGDCSLFKDLVLFFATAIGIASGQFSVRPCSAGDELATPSAVYGERSIHPTCSVASYLYSPTRLGTDSLS